MIHHMQATASHTANFKARFLETKLHEACARYRLAVPSVSEWDINGVIPKAKSKLTQPPTRGPPLRHTPPQRNEHDQPAKPSGTGGTAAAPPDLDLDSDSDSDTDWDHQALHSMAAALNSDDD